MILTKTLFPMLDIGDFTYGNPSIIAIGEGANFRMGKFCAISEAVVIMLGAEHRTDWVSTYPWNDNSVHDWGGPRVPIGHPRTKGDVIIGNDCWLGFGALILSGVTIGDGACIGADSVVTRDVPSYCIAAGNPARIIRKRFDDDAIKFLLDLCWWDWPIERIERAIPILCSPNVYALRGEL